MSITIGGLTRVLPHETTKLSVNNFFNKFWREPISSKLGLFDKIIAVTSLVLLNIATCFLFSPIFYCLKKRASPSLTHELSSTTAPEGALGSVSGAGAGEVFAPSRRVTTRFEEALDKEWQKMFRDAGAGENPSLHRKKLGIQKILTLNSDLQNHIIDRLEFIKELTCLLVQCARPYPFSRYERKYPSTASCDTIQGDFAREYSSYLSAADIKEVRQLFCFAWMYDNCLEEVKSNQQYAILLQDASSYALSKEIARRFTGHYYGLSFSDDDIIYEITDSGKHLILQPGQRSCVTAAAAMIISDRLGHKIEFETVNLANDDSILWMITSNRLQVKKISPKNWGELSKALEENGPACMSCNSIGSHKIVIDRVEFYTVGAESGEPKAVHIRDPYHGWAIAVTPTGFLRNLDRCAEGRFPTIELIHAVC